MYDADEDPMRFTLGVNVQLMMISKMLMLTVMVMMLMVSLVETALHWMKVCWYQIVRKVVNMENMVNIVHSIFGQVPLSSVLSCDLR